MAKAPGSWKAFERWAASMLGGTRRGAYTGSAQVGGRTDVIHEVWGVECKHLKRPTFGVMLGAAKQAAEAAEPGQYPLAVVHRKGDAWGDSLVIVTMDEFAKWFPPEAEESEKAA